MSDISNVPANIIWQQISTPTNPAGKYTDQSDAINKQVRYSGDSLVLSSEVGERENIGTPGDPPDGYEEQEGLRETSWEYPGEVEPLLDLRQHNALK